MKYLFIQYPKCSTCKNAKKFLDENKIEYMQRNIVEECPSYEELKEWIDKSHLPIKKFFNTSGNLYKQMNLKDKLKNLSENEQIQLLSTNGMLIKRPLLVLNNKILVGFKIDEWKNII